MSRVALDADGRLALPSPLRRRYGLEAGEELLVQERITGLVLHLLRPDAHKVSLEVTSRCNLPLLADCLWAQEIVRCP